MYRSLNLEVIDASGRQSECLECAMTHQFEGIDVDVAALEETRTLETLAGTRQLFASAKVSLEGFALPVDWQADDTQWAATQKRLQSLIQFAKALGMRYAEAAVRPDTKLPFPLAFETHVTRLGEVARQLDEAGIKLGISFTTSEKSEDSQPFVDDVEKFKALLEAVEGDNVGCIVHTCDWVAGGGDIDEIASLGDKLLAVRVASFADDSAKQESDRTLPHSEGDVDNAKVVALLAESGYEGPIIAWPSASAVDESKTDPAVRRIRKVFEKLWIDAGLVEAPPEPESVNSEEAETK